MHNLAGFLLYKDVGRVIFSNYNYIFIMTLWTPHLSLLLPPLIQLFQVRFRNGQFGLFLNAHFLLTMKKLKQSFSRRKNDLFGMKTILLE